MEVIQWGEREFLGGILERREVLPLGHWPGGRFSKIIGFPKVTGFQGFTYI